MKKLTEFVSEHISDDITRLILDKARWPETDMDLAVSCIESRRKLKGKVQEWYDEPELIFPVKLSAEQCSSSATAEYKARLAGHIAGSSGLAGSQWRIADLTGGLGVDSWYFSQKAGAVLYNEMQKPLCDAATHNFNILGASKITISNHAVSAEGSGGIERTPEELLSSFRPDIVYMDPARRGEGGKKVFLIEECTPDILKLKDKIFNICRHILIKLSPMADISMACSRLGSTCREVHIVASGGECKELLIWMDREWDKGEYSISAVEIHPDRSVPEFRFAPSDEKGATAKFHSADLYNGEQELFLFEPGKALMKAGAFNIISERFGLVKLGTSTHYYITQDAVKASELRHHGKVFRIMDMMPLDKRSIKTAGTKWPKAEVTARNIPMDTDTLRKKLGAAPGNDIHMFGLKSDKAGNLLIITSRT